MSGHTIREASARVIQPVLFHDRLNEWRRWPSDIRHINEIVSFGMMRDWSRDGNNSAWESTNLRIATTRHFTDARIIHRILHLHARAWALRFHRQPRFDRREA
jgi:hypothetical protein